MKTDLSCISCLVRNAVSAAMKTGDPVRQAQIVRTMLAEIARFDFNLPPPVMARRIYAYAAEVTGNHDPYRKQKDESTVAAKQLLREFLEENGLNTDDFESLIRLAIAGNIIDFGVNCDLDLEQAKNTIRLAFQKPVDRNALIQAEQAINRAENILYLLDNCGEAVFDTLLVKHCGPKITLCVKGAPILNDVTRREVADSGFDGLVRRVIDTGDCTPGISMEHSSSEFREAFETADLIISKGQGNFETLNRSSRPILFLFMAKCRLVADSLGAELNSFQIICRNFRGESPNRDLKLFEK